MDPLDFPEACRNSTGKLHCNWERWSRERGIRMRNMQRESVCVEVTCRSPRFQCLAKPGLSLEEGLWMWTVNVKGKEPVAWEFLHWLLQTFQVETSDSNPRLPFHLGGASSVPFWRKGMKAPHFPYDSPPRSSSPAHFSWICRHRLVLSSGAAFPAFHCQNL